MEAPIEEPDQDKPTQKSSLVIRIFGFFALVAIFFTVMALINLTAFLELLTNPGLYIMVLAAAAVVLLWGSDDFGGFGRKP